MTVEPNPHSTFSAGSSSSSGGSTLMGSRMGRCQLGDGNGAGLSVQPAGAAGRSAGGGVAALMISFAGRSLDCAPAACLAGAGGALGSTTASSSGKRMLSAVGGRVSSSRSPLGTGGCSRVMVMRPGACRIAIRGSTLGCNSTTTRTISGLPATCETEKPRIRRLATVCPC
ncbi:hypothetical protein D3C86_1192230 [compost metagenome]